jgi:hypothetical protein
MKDVLVFHYLPILWYRHPIPNDIREFWYHQRPDILDYMQTAYKDLDIQFLPDNITLKLTAEVSALSSETLSQNNFIHLSDLWNFGNEGVYHFIFPHIEKLI